MSAEADKMAAARGYDPDSKIGLANHHPKFGKYFSELQQQQMLGRPRFLTFTCKPLYPFLTE